jgi:co-chaperonin GroES (HSP10)
MAGMRPLSNQVVLKPREDLEDNYASVIRVNRATGLIEPRVVYGEVLAVGPGDQLHPDIPDLRKGDLVLWNLAMIGPPVIVHGQPIITCSFSALLARITDPLTEREDYQALLDVVMTEDAPMEMEKQISQLIHLPGTVQRDGMKESAGDCPITTVWERVVSAGRGITFHGRTMCARCKDHLQRTEVPDVRKGDLVCFNPMHAIDWRRRGRNFRFTPYSELRGAQED